MAKWLRHAGNGSVWPWTEILAMRKDMFEITDAEAEMINGVPANAPQDTHTTSSAMIEDEAVAQEDGDVEEVAQGDDIEASVLALDSKDDVEVFAESFGLVVDKRRSLENMKADVLQALGVR